MNPDVRRSLITTALFLFCAIPGVIAFFAGALYTFVGIHDRLIVKGAVGVSLAVGGSLLILVGTRRWRQWAYVFVFIGFLTGSVAVGMLNPHDEGCVWLLAGGGVALVTSAAVNMYYRKKSG